MPSFLRPTDDAIRDFLRAQAPLAFTYPGVGSTATGDTPAGHVIDRTRGQLGSGEGVFHKAIAAFRRWQQFGVGWAEARPADAPIEAGACVCVVARALGLWWLNAARIVYVVDEQGPVMWRFGFAYGTLPGHVESGEERFLIEWDRADDSVWYELFAFSRPRHPLARLGYPLARRTQKRFARDSVAAMQRAVASA